MSVLVFGLVVAMVPTLDVYLGSLLVAVFAICHGHAHVTEMGDALAAGYFAGILMATGMLHVGGLITGRLMSRFSGPWMVRWAGGAVAVTWVMILFRGG